MCVDITDAPKLQQEYVETWVFVAIFGQWPQEKHIRSSSCFYIKLAVNLHSLKHDDVIKWKHLPRYWPFVRGIHQSPVNSTLKSQWCGTLRFSLFSAWINGWVNNREAGDLRRHCAHYDVTVMETTVLFDSTVHGTTLYNRNKNLSKCKIKIKHSWHIILCFTGSRKKR